MIAASSKELQSKTVLGIINYCRQRVGSRACLGCKKCVARECEIVSVIDGRNLKCSLCHKLCS